MFYELNEAADAIAEDLIGAHHSRLKGIKIAYLFKSKAEDPEEAQKKAAKAKPLRDGKKFSWAKASLVSDKWRALAEDDYKFVIEFDREVWDELSLEQQNALVDHELCHCGNDADGCYMRQHDLEEFREIVKRHGFWKDDVRLFAETARSLFD